MPIYTYECEPCAHSEDHLRDFDDQTPPPVCRHCNKAMERCVASPRVVTFRAGWYEHVGPDPVYCETPQQLQDACNKHGGVSAYLENSNFKVRRDYDGYEEDFARGVEERKRRDRNQIVAD